jgi:hypothetical protein
LLLRSRGISTGRTFIVVVLTALTGTVFVNSVYVWPKMLAATCCLMALTILLQRGSVVLAGCLTTLALLAHGGIAFSLLVLVPVFLRLRPQLRQIGLALGAAALIYVS